MTCFQTNSDIFSQNINFGFSKLSWDDAVGAFIGAFIILGLERLYDWFINSRKDKNERLQITNAFNNELKNNITLCEAIITKLEVLDKNIYSFARFSTYWADTYTKKYVDFSDKDSIRFHSYIYGINALIQQIEDINKRQIMSSSGRSEENGNILSLARQLKEVISKFIKIKKENKVF